MWPPVMELFQYGPLRCRLSVVAGVLGGTHCESARTGGTASTALAWSTTAHVTPIAAINLISTCASVSVRHPQMADSHITSTCAMRHNNDDVLAYDIHMRQRELTFKQKSNHHAL